MKLETNSYLARPLHGTFVKKMVREKQRGHGYKGLQSLLACNFFQECSHIFIFWYCGRNVCFFNLPKFQDPTQPPSFHTPSAKFLFTLQLTNENMGPSLSEKMKMVQNWELAFKFNLLYPYWFRNNRDEWILPNKTVLYHFFCIPLLPLSAFPCEFLGSPRKLEARSSKGQKLSLVLPLWHLEEGHIPPTIPKNGRTAAVVRASPKLTESSVFLHTCSQELRIEVHEVQCGRTDRARGRSGRAHARTNIQNNSFIIPFIYQNTFIKHCSSLYIHDLQHFFLSFLASLS